MRGCKNLLLDRVFQPHGFANFAELRDQATKGTTQMPTLKSTSVLNRPLSHSRVVRSLRYSFLPTPPIDTPFHRKDLQKSPRLTALGQTL